MTDLKALYSSYTGSLVNKAASADSLVSRRILKEGPGTLEGIYSLQLESRKNDVTRLVDLLTKKTGGLTFLAKQGILTLAESGKPDKALADVATTFGVLLKQAGLSGTGYHGSVDMITGNTYLPNRFRTSFLSRTLIEDNQFNKGEIEGGTTTKAVDKRTTSLSSSYSSNLDTYFEVSGSRYVELTQTSASIKLEKGTGWNKKLTRVDNSEGSTKDSLSISPFSFSTLNPTSEENNDIPALDINRGTFNTYNTVRLDGKKYTRSHTNTEELNKKTQEYLTSGSTVRLKMSQAGVSGSYNEESGRDHLNYFIYSGSTDPSEAPTNDLINFKIVVFEPGINSQYYLYFRAYLENFDDRYSGEWNGTNYIGRAESVFNYTGFKRDISLGFKMAASSESELIPLYKKLNRLVGTTAPSYSNTFMRGVFVKLTVGDYIKDVPGFFNSINLTWDKNYPWETSLGKKKGTTPQLPHILDASLSFTPVHDFTPAYARSFITGIEAMSVDQNG
jgi:hypothetical protein